MTGEFINTGDFKSLDEALSGKEARHILLHGDFGMGKSTLLDNIAEQVLRPDGRTVFPACCQEDDEDFGALKRSLASRNLEDYIVEHPAKVMAVLLTSDDGKTICSASADSSGEPDMDILGGMVTAVQNFVQDSAAQATGMVPVEIDRSLDIYQYRDFKLALFRFKQGNITCLIEGEVPDTLKPDLNDLADLLERDFSDRLEKWNGDMAAFPELPDLLGSRILEKYIGQLPQLEPKFRRLRAQTRLLDCLEKLADKSKLAFVLDDIHLADGATLDTLNFLARNLRQNLVIVAASESSAEELGLQNFTEIELSGFNKNELKELLKRFPSFLDEPGDELLEYLIQESNGSPLVLEENAEILNESGLRPRKWQTDLQEKDINLLQTSEEVVAKRLKDLGPDTYAALEWAAVIGNEFTKELFASSYQQDVPDLEKIAEIEQVDNHFKFKESRTRDILLSNISNSKIKHHKVAKTLEAMCQEPDNRTIHQLARLYSATDDTEKAVKYLTQSAQIFEDNYNFKPALKEWQELLELVGGEEKLQTYRNICRLAFHTNKRMGLKYGKKHEKEAEKQKNLEEQVTSLTFLSNICAEIKDFDALEKYAKKAIKLSVDNNYLIGEFWARRWLSTIDVPEKELNSKKEGEKALYLAEKIGDNDILFHAHTALCAYAAQKSNFSKLLKHSKIAKNFVKETNLSRVLTAQNNLGFALHRNGLLNEAIIEYRNSINNAKKIGNEFSMYNTMQNMAEAIAEKGDLEKAVELLEDCLSGFEKLGMENEVSSCKIELALLHGQLAANYKNGAEGTKNKYALDRLKEKLPPIVKNLEYVE